MKYKVEDVDQGVESAQEIDASEPREAAREYAETRDAADDFPRKRLLVVEDVSGKRTVWTSRRVETVIFTVNPAERSGS